MNKENFKVNRKKLFNDMANSSISILYSGYAPKKIGDENYQFTPLRNFYYMTGLNRENFILLQCKKDDVLEEIVFIERFDEIKAKWVGKALLKEEVVEISGIKNVKYIDEFEEVFSSIIFNKRIENIYMDFENRNFQANLQPFELAEKIQKKYPYIKLINSYDIIANYRLIKEKWEIENIKKAIEITKNGIYSMMKNAKPNMREYEIEAYFDFELKKAGVRDFAFKSIAASGENATILHYVDNDSVAFDGDLILFDVGAQFKYYNGDITRTFPVNGKFTEKQKLIYNIVLGGQKKVIENIKPNVEFKKLNEILKEYYVEKLKEIGLIKDKEELSNYYYHGVSHMLGLETHDVGRHNEGVLKENMVFTVEPGLYIKEWGIGIRIEDNVVVTKDGCEVLSKDIIKTIDEIENFMAEK